LNFKDILKGTQLLLFILDASGIDGRNPTDDFRVLELKLKLIIQKCSEGMDSVEIGMDAGESRTS